MKTREKPILTAEEKRVRKKIKRKKARKAFGVILLIIVLFFAVTSVISYIGVQKNINKAKSYPAVNNVALDTENYADGYWNIYSDHGLKVVQLTDIHIGGGWLSTKKDAMAIDAVATMLKTEKPDFVIVTGDIAYPVPFQAGTLNNKSGAKIFATLMETLGIYWTAGYGNHDTELYSFYNREKITDFYSSDDYPHCLLQRGNKDIDGYGNQMFNIVNSDNVITRTLYVIDSHSYTDGDFLGIFWKYDNVHENQIEWYKQMTQENEQRNYKTIKAMGKKKMNKYAGFEHIPSSVFLHIPLPEYKTAWNEFVANDREDTDDVKYYYGVAGEKNEGVYCGQNQDNFFTTMLELGCTDSVFCGHDHLNSFSVNYKGIYLTYGASVDYLAYPGIYKLGTQRGCTVIQIDDEGNIKFNAENYYNEKYVSDSKEDVTMQELGFKQN